MEQAVTSEIVFVTPEMAQSWLEEWAYPYQRTIRKDHVKALVKAAQDGTFLQGTQIRVASENGVMKLVDGQHRLTAVVESGVGQYFSLVIVGTKDDVATAHEYAHTDTGQRRGYADMFRPYRTSEILGIGKKDVDALGSACRFIRGGFIKNSGKTSDGTVRLDILDDVMKYGEAAVAYLKDTEGLTSPMRTPAYRAATFGVAIVTYHYARPVYGALVSDFWKGAILDDGVSIGDSRKAVHEHLLSTGMPNGISGKTAVTPGYSARYIAQCWNAWMRNKGIRYAKVTDPKAPIRLLGTPYTGE